VARFHENPLRFYRELSAGQDELLAEIVASMR
jgi:hypothetical protein